MTISNDSSAPLFAVIGSTGTQGASVIKAIEASSTAYRVRGLMRDTSKSAVKALEARGVEVFATDAIKQEELEKAFQGATYVFAMTTPDPTEIQRGKNQVNAAKKVGVKILVWAGLPSLSAQTSGKYPSFAFDQKAEITTYARTQTSPSFRVIDVQPPGYISNLWTRSPPEKSPDGTWLLTIPASPSHPIPTLDMDEDYGEYVIGAIERGKESLETVYASPEYLSREEQAAILTKVMGKPFKAMELSRETYVAALEPTMLKLNPEHGKAVSQDMANMWKAFEISGYWAGADLAESNQVLCRPARSYEEAIIANKEKLDAVTAS